MQYFHHSKNEEVHVGFNLRGPAHRGFSLIEVMISIGIFVTLTGTILVNQNVLSNRLNLDTLAHQVGQWVRDAQISAMSVRRSSTGSFTSGYGLHFELAQPDQFIYFADVNNDGVYTSTTDSIEQTVELLQGYRITLLCGAHSGTTALACPATVTGLPGFASTNVLDVSFRRPNPDANIRGQLLGAPASTSYSPARITITSPKGLTRTVVVWVTGQVSIQ